MDENRGINLEERNERGVQSEPERR